MAQLTQHAKILRMLRRHKRRGVANYKFPQAGILCANKRIQELREEGYNIRAERQEHRGRLTGVWKYYLTEEK